MMKQFRIHFGDGFPLEERRNSFAKDVWENLADGIHIVLENMEAMNMYFDDQYIQSLSREFRIHCPRTNHARIRNSDSAEDLIKLCCDQPISVKLDVRRFASHIKNIIEQPEFTHCLTYEANFSPPITYCEKYCINHVDRIIQHNYTPTLQDILAIRKPTFAVRESKFTIGGSIFRLIDLAGQKNHRSKWIHYFEDVQAVMYLSALSGYSEMMDEDVGCNKLRDSLDAFSDVVNNKYLWRKDFFLFHTKLDLFQQKLESTSIRVLFRDYRGADDVESSLQYIQDQFTALVPKNIPKTKRVFNHVLCTIDIDKMKSTIKTITQRVTETNLKKTSILF